MITGSVNSIETMGFVDGPGIRTIIFLNSCNKRCLYCHNPEMFSMGELNTSPDDLVNKVLRNKPYFGNNGGVTFSGGEPLIQLDFLIECCRLLKQHDIHVALDTSGLKGDFKDLFDYVDLILLDVKHTNKEDYEDLTSSSFDDYNYFINYINKLNIPVWIRQVIVTDYNDNLEYIKSLAEYLKNINNVKRINFLPYHNNAVDKYQKLNIPYKWLNKANMDIDKCKKLYEEFEKLL